MLQQKGDFKNITGVYFCVKITKEKLRSLSQAVRAFTFNSAGLRHGESPIGFGRSKFP